jgi:deoxyribose-phosphate aldolase
MDLTSLNETDTQASIAAFCEKARTPFGNVAAVCVYPKFLRLVADQFAGTPIKAVTVANFPAGKSDLEMVLVEINNALEEGAQEIDAVFPYTRYLAGERDDAQTFVETCKAACGDNVLLKIILETGLLKDPNIIAEASFDALNAGADFIKTATGKVTEGATFEAVATMLLVVKQAMPQLKRPLGVKVSGGIKDLQQAAQYVELADQIMGRDWVSANHFRIGASKLIDEMIKGVI